MTTSRCGTDMEVIGTICLDHTSSKGVKIPRISNLATLKEQLQPICRQIFEQLGSQQLEATYQRCLKIDLEEAGVTVLSEPEFHLTFKGKVVGSRRADLLLQLASGEKAIVELKAVNEMQLAHMKQLEYYLHHAKCNVQRGYLINFPHDSSFPSVRHQSDFSVSLLMGLVKRVEHLVRGGVSLRLRNAPGKRQVEILEVTRSSTERAHLEPETPTAVHFGVTAKGEECSICIREGRFCRFHIDQKPNPKLHKMRPCCSQ